MRALCFSPDAQHAISAAEGERLVAVWVVPQQGGKKKPGGVAAASLAVAQPVVQLATAGKDCWEVGWVGQGLGCLMQSAAQTAAAALVRSCGLITWVAIMYHTHRWGGITQDIVLATLLLFSNPCQSWLRHCLELRDGGHPSLLMCLCPAGLLRSHSCW